MADKFSKSDIKEIASKLEWKPNKLSYNILYVVMALSLLYIMLIIYLIMQHYSLKCKLKNIYSQLEYLTNEQSNFSNISQTIQENISNHSNDIRYLTKRSERNVDHSSLSERSNENLPLFENEKENTQLFSALRGD